MKFKDKLCQSKRGLAQFTEIVSVRFVSYLYQQHMYYCIDIIQNLYRLLQNYVNGQAMKLRFFNRKVILILVQYLL